MDGLFTLLSLSTVMAAASFLAGVLPLSLSLSQAKLRLISTVGMGVLVGTSLVVIIPEGVETLYSASSSTGHTHTTRRSISFPTYDIHWPIPPGLSLTHSWPNRDADNSAAAAAFDMPGPVIPSSADGPPKTPTKPGVVGALDTEHDHEKTTATGPATTGHEDGGNEVHNESQHAWIGVALLAGFMLMYLIDKLPQYTTPTKPKARTHHIALNNLGRRFNLATSLDRDEESDSFLEGTQGADTRSRSFATTIGLVIHAAADGIALGASSSATNSELSFVIFFAIMIHKAPAAFGLTSVLVKQGLSKRLARAHLLLFSLAAPTGALLTWLLAHLLGGGAHDGSTQNTTWWTGMLLLFSAGTFLYVAMHSMQEASNARHEPFTNGQANGYIEGRDSVQHEQKPPLQDLGAACFGMILPLFLQIGHAH